MIGIPEIKNVISFIAGGASLQLIIISKVDVSFWLWKSHVFVMVTAKGIVFSD